MLVGSNVSAKSVVKKNTKKLHRLTYFLLFLKQLY